MYIYYNPRHASSFLYTSDPLTRFYLIKKTPVTGCCTRLHIPQKNRRQNTLIYNIILSFEKNRIEL